MVYNAVHNSHLKLTRSTCNHYIQSPFPFATVASAGGRRFLGSGFDSIASPSSPASSSAPEREGKLNRPAGLYSFPVLA